MLAYESGQPPFSLHVTRDEEMSELVSEAQRHRLTDAPQWGTLVPAPDSRSDGSLYAVGESRADDEKDPDR
jgi:hypothetical protein